MGPARRDSVPEILEPAIGDLVRTLIPDEAPTRNSSRELVLGGRNASGEIVLRRADGTVTEMARGTDDTLPGLLARGSGPIGTDEPTIELDAALLQPRILEVDDVALAVCDTVAVDDVALAACDMVEIDDLALPACDMVAVDDVALIHVPKVELELADLESKRMQVAAKVRANAEPEVEVVDDLLLDPWFFKTEEEIAAIEDDPTARIIEIKIAPVLDVSSFDDDRWVF